MSSQSEAGFAAPESAPNRRRIILVGLVGNVMEWYDFAVYGYFAAGFLVRPLGGLVFGRIGDLVGRKRALVLPMLAMALPTVLNACLPTYAMIGIAAPVLIVVLHKVSMINYTL